MDLIILFNTFFGFLTFSAWASTAAMLYLYFSKKTFSKHRGPTIDVTRKSVEETAASIIKIYEITKRNV